jgi:hypothetical protein
MMLRPRHWDQFQHYKKRNPPWIKLHRQLLDDYQFHCLPVASRALAPCLWLLASEASTGCIEYDLVGIAFRLRQTEEEIEQALKPLLESGFFECLHNGNASASALLADRLHDAMPETEKRRIREEARPVDNLSPALQKALENLKPKT